VALRRGGSHLVDHRLPALAGTTRSRPLARPTDEPEIPLDGDSQSRIGRVGLTVRGLLDEVAREIAWVEQHAGALVNS
jgi:hypothetical protein